MENEKIDPKSNSNDNFFENWPRILSIAAISQIYRIILEPIEALFLKEYLSILSSPKKVFEKKTEILIYLIPIVFPAIIYNFYKHSTRIEEITRSHNNKLEETVISSNEELEWEKRKKLVWEVSQIIIIALLLTLINAIIGDLSVKLDNKSNSKPRLYELSEETCVIWMSLKNGNAYIAIKLKIILLILSKILKKLKTTK